MIDVALQTKVGAFSLDVAIRSASGITALFGRSGSGKSMTLGLIAGLSRPAHGHIRIDGVDLLDTASGLCRPTHRRRIGLVFQDAQLFPHMSVRRNLLFGRWFAGRRQEGVAFGTVVDTLGLGALLTRFPATLSGGERQRVAIGRALLANPRLLLLDEPLAALDRQRKLDILPLIERVRDDFAIPIIYVSHAADEVVRLAADVIVLENGRVVASGAPDVVLGAASGAGDARFGRVSILTATVGERDEAFDLTALDHPAGRLWLAGRVAIHAVGSPVRLLVHATDVSLAPGDTGPLSIRSSLSGRIAAIEENGALAAVTMALADRGSLVALVTRRALHDLSLGIGSPVRALVNTVALDEGSMPGG